jgi:hypothetical protein
MYFFVFIIKEYITLIIRPAKININRARQINVESRIIKFKVESKKPWQFPEIKKTLITIRSNCRKIIVLTVSG